MGDRVIEKEQHDYEENKRDITFPSHYRVTFFAPSLSSHQHPPPLDVPLTASRLQEIPMGHHPMKAAIIHSTITRPH
jgi:hypothetical protein